MVDVNMILYVILVSRIFEDAKERSIESPSKHPMLFGVFKTLVKSVSQ